LGCLMSLKIHFFKIRTWMFFPKILVQWVSEEQGERFHQDINEMGRRYQCRWNVNIMGDCCWTLQREIPGTSHKRKSNIRSFASESER
jgi:hypothetical protein